MVLSLLVFPFGAAFINVQIKISCRQANLDKSSFSHCVNTISVDHKVGGLEEDFASGIHFSVVDYCYSTSSS